ncbi:MAG: PhnD/SsuA/transferrin family substrate-binding protein [Candidatus Krumholzibacteria bacterium]|nr:PhnD/SsuA/transferrin family substrate-binding protein [Candidatus Krumholzibacteria bacterium]
MKKSNFLKIDYSTFSSYLGRSATVLVFSAIILLAFGALFFGHEDMAHMPISIGVCAFDSARASSALESLADFVREKGGGDIRWNYFGFSKEPSGCDFYLMTSLQASPFISRGELDCSLIATVREGLRYSRGAVIVRPGTAGRQIASGKLIFSSAVSATGFLSPYLALKEAGPGFCPNPGDIDFAGHYQDDARVIFGVLFGAYQAGGIDLERFRFLEKRGVIREGELDVLFEGAPLPEVLMANDRSVDSKKVKGFTCRLPAILERMPHSLKANLAELGIAGFAAVRQEDLILLERFPSIVPKELSDHISLFNRTTADSLGEK